MLNLESEYRKDYKLIAGVDEAGRGPLAGPVVCAAVVLPPDYVNSKINDSKKLSAAVREQLYDDIVKNALCYYVESVDHLIIDRINILAATKQGMRACIAKVDCDLVLTDAVKIECGKPLVSIIKGDQKSQNIAAASILAKVTRDRIMIKYHAQYPQYNFESHKGYATQEHMDNILKYGECDIHRKTFLRNLYQRQCSMFG